MRSGYRGRASRWDIIKFGPAYSLTRHKMYMEDQTKVSKQGAGRVPYESYFTYFKCMHSMHMTYCFSSMCAMHTMQHVYYYAYPTEYA